MIIWIRHAIERFGMRAVLVWSFNNWAYNTRSDYTDCPEAYITEGAD